jgi:hypothetical protein
MKDGCESFIMDWMDDIEKVLVNRPDESYPANKLCFEVTKVN